MGRTVGRALPSGATQGIFMGDQNEVYVLLVVLNEQKTDGANQSPFF